MSEWDKNLIAKAFRITWNEITEYIIIVATDVYGMDINNLDVRFVIQ